MSRRDYSGWRPGKAKRWKRKQRAKKARSYRDRRGVVESCKGRDTEQDKER